MRAFAPYTREKPKLKRGPRTSGTLFRASCGGDPRSQSLGSKSKCPNMSRKPELSRPPAAKLQVPGSLRLSTCLDLAAELARLRR